MSKKIRYERPGSMMFEEKNPSSTMDQKNPRLTRRTTMHARDPVLMEHRKNLDPLMCQTIMREKDTSASVNVCVNV